MGRKSVWPPTMKHHEPSGQAYIQFTRKGKRKTVYLGRYGSAEARQEYGRVVAQLSAAPEASIAGPAPDLLVVELCAKYMNHVDREYHRSHYHRARAALEPVTRLYGRVRADEFGPVALKVVLEEYVAKGHSRNYCNMLATTVRSCWRWGVSEELVNAEALNRLKARSGLRRGRTAAPESPRVRPADPEDVARTLPELTSVVRDMVLFQQLTGARPGEVCALRVGDINRDWKRGCGCWLYSLDEHKNDWRGQERHVVIGPRAQAVLRPYLDRKGPGEYVFDPRESIAESNRRRSKGGPGAGGRKRAGVRPLNPRYSTMSYDHAVQRACKRAGVPPWSPNRLRHLVATDVQAEHDQDAARAVLGHTTTTMTARYAEDAEKAARVMALIG